MNTAVAPLDEASLKTWRTQTRLTLIERRLRAGGLQRRQWSERIDRHLDTVLPDLRGRVVGFCWPYKGEHDCRPVVRRLLERGSRSALPVIVAPRSPLAFREWHEGAAMVEGAHGIPVPRHGADIVPDVVLLPANGFDAHGFRLGYGAGYFDRTLATLDRRPVVFGICYELGRLSTIYPRAHDIALDYIVTEDGAFKRGPAGLAPA